MAFIEARGIGRVYPGGVVANDGVDLSVEKGEVHAVVGENGAGKSTLMKILFGIERPDAGTLSLDGRQVHFDGPRDAIDAGIGMVFQHFSLVPSFSVYENVALGSEPRKGIRFDREAAIARVRGLSEQFRLNVDPMPPVRTLPVGQQQRVEILKALYRNARVLILDEPTAVLAPQEVAELFVAIRSLIEQGCTVIFIAHKLPEVLEISDTITVMRQGRTVGTVKAKDVTEHELATMMVGREVALRVDRAPRAAGAEVCTVSNLRLVNARGADVCRDLSLGVRAGEILGLVGVEGNGQAEVMEAIAGLRHVADGRIVVADQDIVPLSVLRRRGIGIASIPEDRIAEGLATGASVAENIVATRLKDRRYVRNGLLDLKAIKANAVRLIEQFSIRVNGPAVPVGTLSGGNMQKVVVARELSEQPKLLLVSQPTRGVDLGATQFIWKTIAAARDAGAAVLLSSADLGELLALSDRLLVFYRGRIVAAFHNREGLSPETLGTYMLGLSEQSPEELRAGL
ncbi:MAG: ABC transporter ATP-binding protein [Devosia sp. 67-54]|uniref:ABC transporter ATP-binding protein n=1 Tax=unclassified Devosia TaxID=196773 RepID=UPI000969A0C9|nr:MULTISPECIES: ABC transporter ATP-binding protein [unclassified Devosia]MBN9307380.1 ABC transporter ATP-binding protein [Devosia sp.]OJX19710.1 MAG: ABC transporter ATP-binding protein [Devosia sp. 67-54]